MAVELVADYFATLDRMPVFPDVTSESLRAALDATLPADGRDFDALLAVVRDVILPGSRHNGHPRFFGYVSPPGTPAAALADFMASALNSNVTSWRSAPAAAELEHLTVGWIKQILGYPDSAAGLFVSGGSMANFCGLAAAREAKAPGAGARGMTEKALRLYASDQVHFSVPKAAGLLGIGRGNVRTVRTDDRQRIDVDHLRPLIAEDRAAGHIPICVVANLGTVSTGAVDDLNAVADVAEQNDLWLHVDASYGGFAALAASQNHHFAHLHRADSVALDPHKWLYVPVDCGCVLYRDPATAKAAFAQDSDYTKVTETGVAEAFAFWDYSPELSRRFRALKVWMTLAHAGTRVLGEAVERNIACAQHLARIVAESTDFELLAHGLSIVCFRCRAADDVGNEEIMMRVQKGGRSYLSGARVNGQFALRACVLNFRTIERDVEALLDDCRAAAMEVHGRGGGDPNL